MHLMMHLQRTLSSLIRTNLYLREVPRQQVPYRLCNNSRRDCRSTNPTLQRRRTQRKERRLCPRRMIRRWRTSRPSKRSSRSWRGHEWSKSSRRRRNEKTRTEFEMNSLLGQQACNLRRWTPKLTPTRHRRRASYNQEARTRDSRGAVRGSRTSSTMSCRYRIATRRRGSGRTSASRMNSTSPSEPLPSSEETKS